MNENNPANVASAFEMLLEEVEAEIDFVNGIGSGAFRARDYEKAKEAVARAERLEEFRDKVAALRKDWEEMSAAAERVEDEETRATRRSLGRLRKGVRTQEAAYHLPILRTLEEMGGQGKVPVVLERVREVMESILKPVDFEPLASDPENPRWRNAAQWARHGMIHDGLLKADSPRGVWEITDKGRRMLSEARGGSGD
jgi:hypothetical protein